MRAGLPIKSQTPELHPPRFHRHDAPGGEMLQTSKIIAQLFTLMGDDRSEEECYNDMGPLPGSADSERKGIIIHEREQKQ